MLCVRQNAVRIEISYNVITETICWSVAKAVPHAAIQCIDGDALYDFTSTFHISYCNPWNSKKG